MDSKITTNPSFSGFSQQAKNKATAAGNRKSRSFAPFSIQFLTKVARDYGDLPYFRLANQNVYLVNHPDLIREVLVTNQANFTKSRVLQRARVLLGDGLLTSEGSFHVRQRRLVQPAFHRDRLAAYAQVMSESAVRMRDRWKDGSTLEVSEEMMRLTLSIVGKTLFSTDVESEASEIGEAMTTVLKMFRMLMMPFSEYFEKLPLPAVRRFEKARARLDQTIYGLIRERRQSGQDTGDLLSMLLLAQDEDAGGSMTDVQVRDEALTLFLAGHETTANALTWTWYLLSQNPDCEARLHAEIDSVLAGRVPEMADLPQLRYTEMVFAEAMRLYPPAWAIGRMSKAPFELGGISIGAKATRYRELVRNLEGRALVPGSRAIRSGALDAGSSRVAAEVFVFPIWRRNASLHRRRSGGWKAF